jgi:hypothetical protein
VIDDILAQIFGEAVFGRLSGSRRAQLIARLFFGLLGAALGVAGLVHFAGARGLTTNGALRASMLAMFAFFAAFWLFNVALGRRWRWPAIGFVASFVSMFVTRIALGP